MVYASCGTLSYESLIVLLILISIQFSIIPILCSENECIFSFSTNKKWKPMKFYKGCQQCIKMRSPISISNIIVISNDGVVTLTGVVRII
jgi:hypothetical protein